jgi:DNA-binding transcriptional ArsR family regulator
MILTNRIARGIAAGTVTAAYRRWETLRVFPGSTMRTVAGVVRVESIEPVDLELVDAAAAQDAGYRTREELVATLSGEETTPLWRISLTWVGPDPRDVLAEDAALSPSDIDAIDTLLDRLGARTAWARLTLQRIAGQPGITAAQLAEELSLSKSALKRRIRTLKEHGLTRSLTAGYELSPRGRSFLSSAHRRR